MKMGRWFFRSQPPEIHGDSRTPIRKVIEWYYLLPQTSRENPIIAKTAGFRAKAHVDLFSEFLLNKLDQNRIPCFDILMFLVRNLKFNCTCMTFLSIGSQLCTWTSFRRVLVTPPLSSADVWIRTIWGRILIANYSVLGIYASSTTIKN
jgi:hypothetical protein